MKQQTDTAFGKMENETTSNDLSMEEILASIRRIVTDDPAADTSQFAAKPASPESIYELTQMVEDDGGIVDIRSAGAIEPTPTPRTQQQPTPAQTPSLQPAQSSPQGRSTQEPDHMISSQFVDAVVSKLSKLTEVNSQVQQAYAASPGHVSLESLTRDIIRPFLHGWLEKNFETLVAKLLKKWLEKNLPEVVERIVNEEIRKITQTSDDL